jgi:hypothetical protein
MNPDRTAVDVVVHTHWDREWYLDRTSTLARLVAVMQQVLDQLDRGALPSFLFDGQTVALRDLLAVAPPAMAARLRAHAAAGRLVLGPWYVAMDEFLVQGESILRNLEFGLADAAAFGVPQKLGYLPDNFGHVAQMPQLLAQFGIEHAVVWRGADAEHDRFDWQAPDRSVAGTVFLTQGYYQIPLQGLGWPDTTLDLLEKLAARRAPGVGGALLLPCGGDHLAPDPALAERIAAFSRLMPYSLAFGTLEAHVRNVLARPGDRQRLVGELRRNEQAFVLPDVLSTRRHLKREHQALEDRLLGEIEPLHAVLGERAPASAAPALQAAWRTLIEQQAHDSICGCSTDVVHAEMAGRFVQLNQQLDALRADLLAAAGMTTRHRHSAAPGLDVFADDGRFTLFNPLPNRRSGWWTATLFLKGEAPPAGLRIVADGHRELPCVLIAATPASELISPLDDFPERIAGHRVELAVQCALPALGGVALRAEVAATAAPVSPQAPGPMSISNSRWTASIPLQGGRITLLNKVSGLSHEGAFELLSELDAGDSYSFSPPAAALQTREAVWSEPQLRAHGGWQELSCRLSLALPAGLAPDRQGASDQRVHCEGELRLRLFGDEPLLHAELRWTNRAMDQRTRLFFPGIRPGTAATESDTAFTVNQRPVRLVEIPDAPSRREMPVVVLPSSSMIAAGPWRLLHRALHEHEIVRQPGSDALALAVTLVRSVGWLSRRDLRTRGVGAGPNIATPGAQCLGEDRFEFALLATEEHQPGAFAMTAAERFRRPPVVLRGHGLPATAGPDLATPAVHTSSVRRLGDGRLELRLWTAIPPSHEIALDPARWEAVFADGRPDPVYAANPGLCFPQRILTLRERR